MVLNHVGLIRWFAAQTDCVLSQVCPEASWGHVLQKGLGSRRYKAVQSDKQKVKQHVGCWHFLWGCARGLLEVVQPDV